MTAIAIRTEVPMTANRTFPTRARSSVDGFALRGNFRRQGKNTRYAVFVHATEGASLIPLATVVGRHRVGPRQVVVDIEVGTVLVCDGVGYHVTDDRPGYDPQLVPVS